MLKQIVKLSVISVLGLVSLQASELNVKDCSQIPKKVYEMDKWVVNLPEGTVISCGEKTIEKPTVKTVSEFTEANGDFYHCSQIPKQDWKVENWILSLNPKTTIRCGMAEIHKTGFDEHFTKESVIGLRNYYYNKVVEHVDEEARTTFECAEVPFKIWEEDKWLANLSDNQIVKCGKFSYNTKIDKWIDGRK